jgi:hypothetical protein
MHRVSLHVGVLGRVRRPFCVLYKSTPGTAPSADGVPPASVAADPSSRRLVLRAYREVGRTETMPVQTPVAPAFIRAFLLALPEPGDAIPASTRYRVALYDRRSLSEELEDHVFLGSVRFALADVVAAEARVDLPVSRPAAGTDNADEEESEAALTTSSSSSLPSAAAAPSVGCLPFLAPGAEAASPVSPRTYSSSLPTPEDGRAARSTSFAGNDALFITLRGSHVNEALYLERRRIHLVISLPPSRRPQMPYSLVSQVIDVAVSDDTVAPAPNAASSSMPAPAARAWLPLYRSESLREPTHGSSLLTFEPIALPEWRLHAHNRDIRVRILLYDSRARCLRVAAVAVTSLEGLQSMDPLREVVPLVGPGEEAVAAPAFASAGVNSTQAVHASLNRHAELTSGGGAIPGAGVGHLVLECAEPAAFGGVFTLVAKYNSAGGCVAPGGGGGGGGGGLRHFLPGFLAAGSDQSPAGDAEQGGIGGAVRVPSPDSALFAGIQLPDRDDRIASGTRCYDRDSIRRASSPVSLHGGRSEGSIGSTGKLTPTFPSRFVDGKDEALAAPPEPERSMRRERSTSESSSNTGPSSGGTSRMKQLTQALAPARQLVRKSSVPLNRQSSRPGAARQMSSPAGRDPERASPKAERARESRRPRPTAAQGRPDPHRPTVRSDFPQGPTSSRMHRVLPRRRSMMRLVGLHRSPGLGS